MDFHSLERKWAKKWEEHNVFAAKNAPGKKHYILEMFPYPSASGLHVGHAFNYTIGDIYSRYKRMQGYNVLYPMGYDAFGLPAENAAIKADEHPAAYTEQSVQNYITQQKALGFSYDWSRMVVTCRPDYYKWNQYFFIKLFEKGLVYRKRAAVNWCPKCNTVLANEQVHSGKCWRHEDTDVEMKQLEQWFIKTTQYSDELLEDIKKLHWPERIKLMQENWIGKSQGTEVNFEINNEKWPVFTTRIDTIYGVTFLVIAAQHQRLFELVTPEQKSEVEKFLKRLRSVSEKELEAMDKDGVFTGSYAINPLTQEKVPIYAGNFVIADYGSGVVMAVPAHDSRDYEFAKKYNIPIKKVIESQDGVEHTKDSAFTDEGVLVNSKEYSGHTSQEARDKITEHLQTTHNGRLTFNYKFRDWLVSRQRYWGTPIPMVYCEKCGVVPVAEKDLPIILPRDVKFGVGNPLATNEKFVNTTCPQCKKPAKRETDTMDTFFDSSWYYLRYCDPQNETEPFSIENVEHFMPVDLYIGGAEHACMHLIYARFFTKALRDMGMLKFDEPFPRLFNQGVVHGSDGNKMSKSLGNVVNPLDIIQKYSADSLRYMLMSIAAPDSSIAWSDAGIEASHKFITKLYTWLSENKPGNSSARVKNKLHKTIVEVSLDIDEFKYNLALIKLREAFEYFEKEEISSEDTALFIKLLHPFCPFMTEELWEMRGNKKMLCQSEWPQAEEKYIDERLDAADELVASTIADVHAVKKLLTLRDVKTITLIVSAQWKFKLYELLKIEMLKTRDAGQLLKTIMGTDLKVHGQEITKIVPSILKNPGKMPTTILGQDAEIAALEESIHAFNRAFDADVEIVAAENSEEPKAKVASPGKPAILLK